MKIWKYDACFFQQVIKEANECTTNWFAKHFLIPFLTNAGHFLQRIMMMRKSRERIHLNFFTVLKTKERASRVLVITSQSWKGSGSVDCQKDFFSFSKSLVTFIWLLSNFVHGPFEKQMHKRLEIRSNKSGLSIRIFSKQQKRLKIIYRFGIFWENDEFTYLKLENNL